LKEREKKESELIGLLNPINLFSLFILFIQFDILPFSLYIRPFSHNHENKEN